VLGSIAADLKKDPHDCTLQRNVKQRLLSNASRSIYNNFCVRLTKEMPKKKRQQKYKIWQ